jgi:predicted amidophosphoribosyltransferase
MSKLICPNCGAPRPAGVAGRVVCECCGSLLADEEARRDGPLGINDQWLDDNTGALRVAVVVEAPG